MLLESLVVIKGIVKDNELFFCFDFVGFDEIVVFVFD